MIFILTALENSCWLPSIERHDCIIVFVNIYYRYCYPLYGAQSAEWGTGADVVPVQTARPLAGVPTKLTWNGFSFFSYSCSILRLTPSFEILMILKVSMIEMPWQNQ